MDILIFGQQNWDVCWTAKQHIATGLAGQGHRVIYVDPDPGQSGFILLDRNLWLSRDRPWPLIGWRANQERARRLLDWRMRSVGFTAPVTLVLHPSSLARLGRHGVVYYAVDDYGQYDGMTGAARDLVYRQEADLLAGADVALAVSPALVDRFRAQAGEAHLLENGADVEHFAPQRLDRMRSHPLVGRLEGPVLGFFGQIDGRLDQDLLLALARQRPRWNFVLAGRVKGIATDAIAASPNVHLLGYQDYGALPSIARDVDVWLLPYRQTALTHACNPLKVYEYLATGKPVVATPLDGLVGCRAAVSLVEGTEAWMSAIAAALADPAQDRLDRLELAHRNAWPARVAALEQHLQTARERAFGDSALARRIRATTAPRASPLPVRTTEYGLPAPRLKLGMHLPLLLAARALGATRRALRLGRGLPARPRILWARRANLGDVIVSLPALKALRTAFPQAYIAAGIGSRDRGGELLRQVPDIDEVLPGFIWSGQGRRHELRQLLRLWRRRFDVVIQSGEALFEPEGAFAGAPRMVSLYDGHPMSTVAGLALLKEFHLHEARNALRLAEAVAGRRLDDPGYPELPALGASAFDASSPVARALAEAGEGGVLVVHPGSSKPTRRWPDSHFAACLAQVLAARPGLRVVLTGTDSERDLAQRICAAVPAALAPRITDGMGQTTVAELAALLRRADALLCNDTGILHLGRACGTPMVAVLGPENARLWGPHPTGAAPATALRVEVPCAPCALHSCAAHWCMRLMNPQLVAEELLRLLDGERARSLPTGLRLRTRSTGWQMLAQAGEVLPLYSLVLVVADQPAAWIDGIIAAVEAQTYPAIELVLVRPAGTPPFEDRRDTRCRAALPLRQVAAAGGRSRLMAAGIAAARGALVRDAAPSRQWLSSRLATDMAAAVRAPEVHSFRDGAPAAEPGTEPTWQGGVAQRSGRGAGWAGAQGFP